MSPKTSDYEQPDYTRDKPSRVTVVVFWTIGLILLVAVLAICGLMVN